ncbi:CD109 antigen-like [Dreissena polymorpha]|uniref:Alpha-macroglobulin receptor-binding domain-containing protein n=1 Tax=Dreissena polymorpha TaxID=45954 RepID=A0A9D4L971_DREPO|nr:CD109 antigen-like [Dreissena polymorpha]KAH3853780.1 hypothetical protein DPMN_096312 [Dreissena polymorpha]
MDLPDIIVKGEEVVIQVSIFHYLPTRQQVFMSIQHSDDPQQPTLATIEVQPGGHSIFVKLTPQNIGDITITAMARAGDLLTTVAMDTLQRTITVKPNGLKKNCNKQHLIHLHPALPTASKTVSLATPLNIVQGSDALVTVKITGDFMIPSINGLQNLLKQPHGCGEQNMVDFAPNVYVYKYLKAVGELTSTIEKNTQRHLEFGYQNELAYKHRDGSFSAFGESDSSGSSWLTAFVLKCFGQARALILIDDNVLKKAMVWLLFHQYHDGSFDEPGKLIRWFDQSGSGHGNDLNSFILISLLENKDFHLVEDSKLSTAITLGVQNLEYKLIDVQDAYTMAIMCYTLALAESSLNYTCMNKLKAAAVIDGEQTFWSSRGTVGRSGPLLTRALARDIEATGYALLAYIEMNMVTEAFSIVKWLVSQRNPTGGYQSTQDTVVALQALSKFSELFGLDKYKTANYGVKIRADGPGFSHQYAVTKFNFDMIHSVEVYNTLSYLNISATGYGIAVIDVSMTHYVQGAISDNFITVSVPIVKESINSITINPCVRWTGNTTSNMLLVEIEMPTGFMHDTEVLNVQATIRRYERNGRNLALYFDSLDSREYFCVSVTMDRFQPTAKSQACHVVAYDYYEPTHQAIAVYESEILKKATICDVCPLCEWCHIQQFQPSIVG